jgi:hypothetical protein
VDKRPRAGRSRGTYGSVLGGETVIFRRGKTVILIVNESSVPYPGEAVVSRNLIVVLPVPTVRKRKSCLTIPLDGSEATSFFDTNFTTFFDGCRETFQSGTIWPCVPIMKPIVMRSHTCATTLLGGFEVSVPTADTVRHLEVAPTARPGKHTPIPVAITNVANVFRITS